MLHQSKSLTPSIRLNLVYEARWLEESIQNASQWLHSCRKEHVVCSEHVYTRFPTRLVDVGPQDGSQEPHLFVPNSLKVMPGTYRYTALSYCWGNPENNIKTTCSNLEERKKSISLNTFPQTIRHAILLTRSLNIRYIWIDALCIIQGPGGDWGSEYPEMADVYGGAFLTISAAISPHVDAGLLRPDQKKYPLNQPDRRAQNSTRDRALEKEPLYQRGWALQERVLSPRVLIFGHEQMYWDCHEQQQGVDGTKIGPFARTRLKDSRGDLFTAWERTVCEFSSRKLSVQSDKLPALSGIAAKYYQSTQFEYLAGLWKQNITGGLSWRHTHLVYGSVIPPSVPTNYRAPSWSWASVDGNITYHPVIAQKGFKPRISLLSSSIQLKDPSSPFGECLSGSITLRGFLLPARVQDGTMELILNDGRKKKMAVWMDKRDKWPDQRHSTKKRRGSVVFCLELGVAQDEGCGLVLSAVAGRKGVFRRDGLCYLDDEHYFKGVEDTVITVM